MPETRTHNPDDSNDIANLVRAALESEEPNPEPITEAVESANISNLIAVTPTTEWQYFGTGGQ